MKKCTKLLAAAALIVAATLPLTSLFAQQTSFPSVVINGVRYIPETAQAPASGNYVVAQAPAAYYAAPRAYDDQEFGRRGHFGFGPGAYILNFQGGDSNAYGGVWVGGGFNAVPSNIGSLRFNLDLGIYYWGKSTTVPYVDGKYISYKSGTEWSLAMPLLANADYEFNLDSHRHWRARAGVVLGGTTFVNADVEQNTKTTTVFTYGPDLGVSFTPRDKFYLDLSYRFLGNTGDYSKTTAHQINIGVGWRY